jgi:uncharacterized protein
MRVNYQVLFVTAALTCAMAQQPPAGDFILQQNVTIPMRDGVLLRADILRPTGGGPFPILVYRTPYGKHFAQKEYTIFRRAVQRGYAIVVQDVRGRYASDGEFRPYENEGRDGYDTIEWAARQEWSNGNVGTFGLSYPGAVQWLAAVESPPHLKAMVPAMTFSTPQNFFYASGTWDMSWIEWIWDNIAPDVRARKNLPGAKTAEEAIATWKQAAPRMLNTLPLKQLEDLRGVAPYYYDWLSHPAEDPWWDWAELRDKYRRVHAAVLNFSGWYDDNYGPEGATTNFNGLLKSRAKDSEKRTHLLLGAWVHGVDATAKTKSGEREFGRAVGIDYDEVVLHWMDRYLRGSDDGIDKEKPVRYFVMGDNRWRDADSWPPPATPVEYYLNAPPAGSNRGTLSRERLAHRQVTTFVSDPGNPVLNAYDSSGAHDYRKLAERRDVLLFDSAPMERDLEVTGPIAVKIFVSCDCRDFDLWVRLLDLAPDGAAFNLMSPGLDVQRASYREMKKGRQLLRPGKIYELGPASLLTSNVFQKGHRIRVQISGSFFPNFSRNLQSGELENGSATLQKATISIHSDHRYPSRIVLPVTPQPQ